MRNKIEEKFFIVNKEDRKVFKVFDGKNNFSLKDEKDIETKDLKHLIHFSENSYIEAKKVLDIYFNEKEYKVISKVIEE